MKIPTTRTAGEISRMELPRRIVSLGMMRQASQLDYICQHIIYFSAIERCPADNIFICQGRAMVREASHNLTQGAYEALRADLLACRIAPGSRLKIQDLCQQHDVSLGAIREALSRLTSEGLVVAEPQRGFRAAPISRADLEDLTMARIEVEGLCLTRAIAVGTVDWEARLVAAFHRLSRTPERVASDPARSADDWAEAHAGFHGALVDGADSPWLLRLHAQ